MCAIPLYFSTVGTGSIMYFSTPSVQSSVWAMQISYEFVAMYDMHASAMHFFFFLLSFRKLNNSDPWDSKVTAIFRRLSTSDPLDSKVTASCAKAQIRI